MAPAVQLLLLFYGVALPGNWVWQLLGRTLPAGWSLVVGTDLFAAVIALGGALQVRRGHLRGAVQVFIGALLLSALATWSTLGASAMLIDQTPLLLVLVMAGLVLGRRALWGTYACITVVVAVGLHADYHAGHDAQWTAHVLRNGPSLLLAYLVIAFILDNTASALRQSLRQAHDQGVALDQELQIRERLQQQLLHARKLDIVGRLTTGVAHDFNNVLAVVSGSAKNATGSMPTPAGARPRCVVRWTASHSPRDGASTSAARCCASAVRISRCTNGSGSMKHWRSCSRCCANCLARASACRSGAYRRAPGCAWTAASSISRCSIWR